MIWWRKGVENCLLDRLVLFPEDSVRRSRVRGLNLTTEKIEKLTISIENKFCEFLKSTDPGVVLLLYWRDNLSCDLNQFGLSEVL